MNKSFFRLPSLFHLFRNRRAVLNSMEKPNNSDGTLKERSSASNSQTPTEYLSDIASRMSSTFFENLDQAGFKFQLVLYFRLFNL